MKKTLLVLLTALSGTALAAPVSYQIDPTHTFPSFEADHMGVSVWRGKFNTSSGKVTLDKEAGYGMVDISIDPASVDFGHDVLNKWAAGPDLFDVAKYGMARYKGKLTGFKDGAPTQLQGELTLHGVTRPVSLQIKSFKCIPHPMLKKEMCGADAYGSFKRDEFGLTAGKDYGFKMDVDLRIQAEAVAD